MNAGTWNFSRRNGFVFCIAAAARNHIKNTMTTKKSAIKTAAKTFFNPFAILFSGSSIFFSRRDPIRSKSLMSSWMRWLSWRPLIADDDLLMSSSVVNNIEGGSDWAADSGDATDGSIKAAASIFGSPSVPTVPRPFDNVVLRFACRMKEWRTAGWHLCMSCTVCLVRTLNLRALFA